MKTSLLKTLLLLSVALVFLSCSTTAPVKKTLILTAQKKNQSVKKNKSHELYAQLGNFDKVYIPNQASLISHMISVVQPELDIKSRNKIAMDIYKAIQKFRVEPQIIVSLIDTESNFSYRKVSSTGDLSIGQVNVEVWNNEFKRMKLPLISKAKLVTKDQSYAMEKMAQILSILKKRHSKKDRRWYARYHSNTSKHKLDYLKKIEIRMKMLAESPTLMSSNSLAFSSQSAEQNNMTIDEN